MVDTAFDKKVESALCALERGFGIAITIIDRYGVFHNADGLPIFSRWRQSHQKNEVCRIGFCQACVQHCRHQMNEKGEKLKRPFVHSCWKGLQELVIPLLKGELHLGSLYAGVWRTKNTGEKHAHLPDKFIKAYRQLTLLEERRLELEEVLWFFSQGLIAHLDKTAFLDEIPTPRKQEIWRQINNNAGQPFTLHKLAQALYLSDSRTSHLVKALFGASLGDLLRKERLKRAKALLLGSEYSLGEIARQVGMNNEFYFNRWFKSETGRPPGQFRRNPGFAATSTQPVP